MKNPMTKEGYDRLMAELKQLKSVKRPEVIEAIAIAREFGDISENAEYHQARDEQSWIEGRIQELEDKIINAQVIDVSKLKSKTIVFGATVEVGDEDTGQEYTHTLLGDVESDLKNGIISISSPMGKALLGKEKGDTVDFLTPSGQTRYFEILSIKYQR
jgi:transcription elongation factor GreA